MLTKIHGVPHRPMGVDSRDILHVVDTPKIGIPGSGIHNCVAPARPAATVEIVGERVGQGLETSIVGLLAVLVPPWGDFTFPFVPPAAQRGHRPVGPALVLDGRAPAQLASNMQ